jgi:spermidine/putrescine transport system permease protein
LAKLRPWQYVVIAVAVVGIVVFALRGSGSKEQLNLFCWTEYIPQSVLDAFAEEYDVKVNYATYSSNEEMLAKLTAGAAGYDVIIPSDYVITVLGKQGKLMPLNKELLPNLINLDPAWLDLPFDPDNVYSVPFMWGTVGIVVNTEKEKEPITSFRDLWKPQYKGKIVVIDGAREMIGLALQMLGKSHNAASEADLQAAKNELRSLMPSIKAFDSDSPKSILLAGDVTIGVVWSGEAALVIRDQPGKFAYVLPEEGGSIWMDSMVIPTTSQNPELAHKFINFILRPDISAQLSNAFLYGNPNLAAQALMDPEMLSNPASYPPAAALTKAEWLDDVGSASALYDRVWTELKGE